MTSKNESSSGTRVGLLEKSKTNRKRDRSQTKTRQSAISKRDKSTSQMKMQSKTSNTEKSSSSTGDVVVTTPTTADTSVQPKRTGRCRKWLMIGSGAALLTVGVLVYFLLADSKADDRRPPDDVLDVELVTADNSTEQTPATDVTSQEPVIIIGSSTDIALATTEASGFKVPLAGKIIGGVAGGIVGLYMVCGFVFKLTPPLQQCYGSREYFNMDTHPVGSPPFHFLPCTKNFSLSHPANPRTGATISIGAWYIPPHRYCPFNLDYINLNDGRFVVVIAGGSGHGDRSDEGYIKRYQVMIEQLDFHVLAFDYRGNADSTEAKGTLGGFADDAQLVFDWILKHNAPRKKVLFWGHSLGTVVQIKLLSMLSPNESPLGAVLEASSTNLTDFDRSFQQTRGKTCCNMLPCYEYFFLKPMQKNPDIGDNSWALLPKVHVPLLLLHAQDDCCVYYKHSIDLYKAAKEMQPENVRNKTRIALFRAEEGCDHWDIPCSPRFPSIVRNFTQSIM